MNTTPKVWGLVPARGGSKSIPKKNLASLNGRPLIDYGVEAAKKSGIFDAIYCSTDDKQISDHAISLGIKVDQRPPALATDEAAVADVARDFIKRHELAPHDLLVLIQPTSPFLLPQHIIQLVDLMKHSDRSMSAQTITPIPHNYHAWNQRATSDGQVSFFYAKERREAYNKQKKPKLFSFGNLVVARAMALANGGDFFHEPSLYSEISWPYNLDVDTSQDLKLAEAFLREGFIEI